MRRSEILAVWNRVGALLRAGRAQLPVPPGRPRGGRRDPLVAEFEAHAAANEWELAWDALAAAAAAHGGGTAELWRLLAEAARLMGLDDRRADAERRGRDATSAAAAAPATAAEPVAAPQPAKPPAARPRKASGKPAPKPVAKAAPRPARVRPASRERRRERA